MVRTALAPNLRRDSPNPADTPATQRRPGHGTSTTDNHSLPSHRRSWLEWSARAQMVPVTPLTAGLRQRAVYTLKRVTQSMRRQPKTWHKVHERTDVETTPDIVLVDP